MIKVLILGDVNSIHIIKWANALSANNIYIGIFSFSDVRHQQFENNNQIRIKTLQFSEKNIRNSTFKKLQYLKGLPLLQNFIKEFKPDIVHAHYASSYGLLGALSKFHPFVISVWGSDVFDFPNENSVFKKIIEYNLSKADRILSTSHIMAKETQKYTDKEITVTPFGVDLDTFKPFESSLNFTGDIHIGTVKSLERKYGIDVLIKAFAETLKQTDKNVVLHIVGDGDEKENLKRLCIELDIDKKVIFHGKIKNIEVPDFLNSFDIYVALSRLDSESFGVAIVEAEACEVPVIVSNKGGLAEVVDHLKTGIIVENENVEEASKAMLELINDEQLRNTLGENGRKKIIDLYDWDENVQRMIQVYKEIMQ